MNEHAAWAHCGAVPAQLIRFILVRVTHSSRDELCKRLSYWGSFNIFYLAALTMLPS
jgi:hypothetical protein